MIVGNQSGSNGSAAIGGTASLGVTGNLTVAAQSGATGMLSVNANAGDNAMVTVGGNFTLNGGGTLTLGAPAASCGTSGSCPAGGSGGLPSIAVTGNATFANNSNTTLNVNLSQTAPDMTVGGALTLGGTYTIDLNSNQITCPTCTFIPLIDFGSINTADGDEYLLLSLPTDQQGAGGTTEYDYQVTNLAGGASASFLVPQTFNAGNGSEEDLLPTVENVNGSYELGLAACPAGGSSTGSAGGGGPGDPTKSVYTPQGQLIGTLSYGPISNPDPNIENYRGAPNAISATFTPANGPTGKPYTLAQAAATLAPAAGEGVELWIRLDTENHQPSVGGEVAIHTAQPRPVTEKPALGVRSAV